MTQKRSVLRKIGKFLAYAVALVVVVLTSAHFAWKYSGSNQWELWRDTNLTPAYNMKGRRLLPAQVYTKKVPGETRLQFKVVAQIRGNLDAIAAGMSDMTTEGCHNFLPTCTAGKIYKNFDEKDRTYIQDYRIVLPKWLPKEMAVVNRIHMWKDPQTKALLITVKGVPELLPKDGCCILMTHLNNQWKFTPLENGMLEFEFTEDDDPGIPYYIYNPAFRRNKVGVPDTSQRVFNMEKYQHRKFEFLRDPVEKKVSDFAGQGGASPSVPSIHKPNVKG
ncbi:MAG TPA: hypothetical protein VNN08_03710 [Thermoanaerobaculia bacterium]|nr:hypothetical protein [Thermoanaerobaculia bacterium]